MTFAHIPYEKGSKTFQGPVMKGVFLTLFGSLMMAAACHRTIPPTSLEETSVAMGVFENKTPELILEGTLAFLLHEAWIRRHLVMVPHPEKAAFVLAGTIDQITETPRSLNREGGGVAHRITIGVTYRLSSQKNEPPITWKDTAHADWFTRAADLPYDRSERNRALWQAFMELFGKAANRFTEIMLSRHPHRPKT